MDVKRQELILSTAIIGKKDSLAPENVLCLYELKSRRGRLLNLNVSDFISISFLYRKETDEIKKMYLKSLIVYGWFRYVFKRGAKTKKRCSNKTKCLIEPGKVICFAPNILKKMNVFNMKSYQCNIESDFAIRNHVLMYNLKNKPRIITNDTDMVVLLCDVDC
jgi:hypothetical protein